MQSLKIAGEYGRQGIQSLSSGDKIDTTQSLWNHIPEFDSGSAQMNAHGRTSNLPSAGGLDSFIYAPGRPSNLSAPPGILESSMSRPSAHDQVLHSTLEQSYQFTWPQHDYQGVNAENRPTGHCIPGNDQLSTTSEFLLVPKNSMESRISVSQLSEVQLQNKSGISICETSSDTAKFRKQNSTDWVGITDLDVQNSTYPYDFSRMLFDQGQFDFPLRDDSSLTVAEKQRFSIREISPEWSYSFESTKKDGLLRQQQQQLH